MQMTYLMDVTDGPGVLTRVSLVFRRRGVNLSSVTTTHSERDDSVRMLLTADVDVTTAYKLRGHLAKLVDVHDVTLMTPEQGTVRAFAMLKVQVSGETRGQLLKLIDAFHARVIETDPQWMLVETTGTPDAVHEFAEALARFGVMEAVSTGPLAIRSLISRHADGIAQLEPVADATGDPAPLET